MRELNLRVAQLADPRLAGRLARLDHQGVRLADVRRDFCWLSDHRQRSVKETWYTRAMNSTREVKLHLERRRHWQPP